MLYHTYIVKGTYSSYGNGQSFARYVSTLASPSQVQACLCELPSFCTWFCLKHCHAAQLLASSQGASSFSIRWNSVAGVKLSLTLIQFANVMDNSICKFLFDF